jgi:hypothetical protein
MKLKPNHILYFILVFVLNLSVILPLFSMQYTPVHNSFHSGTDFVSLTDKFVKVESDSVSSTKISKVWYTQTELNVQVYQTDKQQEISITVYNMLGKEVLEVFRGTSSSAQEEVYTTSFNLPNGIYICVLQSKNFKDTEKFIISR